MNSIYCLSYVKFLKNIYRYTWAIIKKTAVEVEASTARNLSELKLQKRFHNALLHSGRIRIGNRPLGIGNLVLRLRIYEDVLLDLNLQYIETDLQIL